MVLWVSVSAPEYPLQQINFNRIRSVGISLWPKPHIPRTEQGRHIPRTDTRGSIQAPGRMEELGSGMRDMNRQSRQNSERQTTKEAKWGEDRRVGGDRLEERAGESRKAEEKGEQLEWIFTR